MDRQGGYLCRSQNKKYQFPRATPWNFQVVQLCQVVPVLVAVVPGDYGWKAISSADPEAKKRPSAKGLTGQHSSWEHMKCEEIAT